MTSPKKFIILFLIEVNKVMYYNRIKACNANTTSLNSGSWTFLVFQGRNTSANNDIGQSPIIQVASSANASGSDLYSLGHIITTDCTSGYILNSFTFKNELRFTASGSDTTGGRISYDSTGFKVFYALNGWSYSNLHAGIKMEPSQMTLYSNLSAVSSAPYMVMDSANFKFYSNTSTCVFDIDTSDEEITTSYPLTDESYVQALYFNATSDIRAKESIETAAFSALDFISNAEVKTFTYKKSKAKSIGLIAQDVKDFDFGNGFSIVENAEASGEHGDYMSIRESKLVYVLMKGIQEQQAQIEQLKQEIEALKKTSN